ncbi:MAG: hypothetical protein ABWZ91_08555 [Nocardioides sp.]|jgi:hypothetical protein
MAQSQESRELEELRMENAQLMEDVDKYRTAMEDALQQLDWCIGYFTGAKNSKVARSLGANRAHIRTKILKRAEQSLPTNGKE